MHSYLERGSLYPYRTRKIKVYNFLSGITKVWRKVDLLMLLKVLIQMSMHLTCRRFVKFHTFFRVVT